MATNCVINPLTIRTYTAPGGGVTSGTPVWDTTSLILAVPLSTASAGESYAAAVDGVWTLPAVALQAWTAGDPIYWNPATSSCDNVAGALTRIGTAYAAKSNGASYTTGQVDLGVRP